jgi:hypothetical protein
MIATLGLAATPDNALGIAASSEATWTLATGGLLFLLATAVRRAPARKE